jgi:peptide deformylase
LTVRLTLYPDPILKLTCQPVGEVDKGNLTLAREMLETMQAYDGLAIAAPQVGSALRVVVISSPVMQQAGLDEDVVMLNPILTAPVAGETLREAEGCLSFPGVNVMVERFRTIRVDYLGVDGQPHTLTADGQPARVIQHEVDHLNGVTIMSYAGPLRRNMAKKKLSRLRKEMAERGPPPPKVPIYKGKEKGVCQDCTHFTANQQVTTIGACNGRGHDIYGLPVGDLVYSSHGCTRWEQRMPGELVPR